MKKTLLLFLLYSSSYLFAQTTYLSTDYATQNESFIVSTATAPGLTLDFVQTGANFNWDYSALEPASQQTITYQNPNNAGYKTIWCLFNGYIVNCNSQFNNNFNLATKLTDGLVLQGIGLTNVIDHLKLSTTSLEDKMIGANITFNGTTVPFVASFQSPDVLYQFPINYNDNYTNNSVLNLDLTTFGVPILIASTGQRTNLVEGWGSLVTPFGTYANVLKMKTTLVSNVTITNNGVPQQTTVTTVSYKWFDPAHGIPVLQVDGNLVGSVWTPTAVNYFDIERCLAPNALFAYLPVAADFDPVANNASVSFVNASTNYDTLTWNFGDGSPTTTAANPTHNYSCPGTYDVTLEIVNDFCSPSQTDSITIPVVITDSQNVFTTEVLVGDASLLAVRDYAGTTYQWLDCDNGNAPIPGATGQTFTPTSVNGNYAVQLTTNGCVSISDCYTLGVLNNPNFNLENAIAIAPNPTTGIITISSLFEVKEIAIFSVLGELISNRPDLSQQASGIYFVKITTDKGSVMRKIIKE
ncbi:MAG: T9SS type A sorting domain-containing protein [Flavobacterium sp.]|nr:T9SS type A sorting domain-containing protein [Flavobacterium sp.]